MNYTEERLELLKKRNNKTFNMTYGIFDNLNFNPTEKDLYLLQDEGEEEEEIVYTPTPMGGPGTATRSTADLGGKISTSRTITSGLDPSLQKSLTTYLSKASKIKDREKKKSIYILDRFDGGLNLSTSPRDLSFWESPWMDELMPSKAGRLVRLGDFKSEALSLSSAFS